MQDYIEIDIDTIEMAVLAIWQLGLPILNNLDCNVSKFM